MAFSLSCSPCWSTIVSGDSFITGSSSTLRFSLHSSPANLRFTRSITCVSAASKTPTTGKTEHKPRGITKPKPISPEMQELLGVPEIPRTQALKQIWAYIKENNLQDPNNKKVIVCDEKLKKIFAGKERVGFLEISGLINPHFIK